jgi:hypothetical protein
MSEPVGRTSASARHRFVVGPTGKRPVDDAGRCADAVAFGAQLEADDRRLVEVTVTIVAPARLTGERALDPTWPTSPTSPGAARTSSSRSAA